ncbi:MAG: Gfo/Idh/MocA family oxidoreductase [Capsulimonadales bacterium]|nr:Gfo/Idh/MocA family oxidoreductase [Capsulimonadales bacterium]
MSVRPVNFGIIGCGNISNAYFNATKKFDVLQVIACADIDLARAEAKAKEHNVPRACSPEELLADPEIEIVINLTIPNAHYSVCKAALEAGKHVHVEKPLSVTFEQGRELVELATARGLRIGCAPDTFLGGGHQTCRKLIDDGVIGEPIAATAFMLCRGHESWHPSPEFYYKAGGGPMFDMGPYYLTALVNMIGGIRRVSGATRITFPERLITSKPLDGTKIRVDVPTHVAGLLDFANGAVATIVTSFDVYGAPTGAPITVFGTEGTIQVPDPNGFGGTVRVKTARTDWEEVALTHGYTENARGIGAADIAYAIQSGRPHRASGGLGLHVLEAMHGFHVSSEADTHYRMTTTTDRPALLVADLPAGKLDE